MQALCDRAILQQCLPQAPSCFMKNCLFLLFWTLISWLATPCSSISNNGEPRLSSVFLYSAAYVQDCITTYFVFSLMVKPTCYSICGNMSIMVLSRAYSFHCISSFVAKICQSPSLVVSLVALLMSCGATSDLTKVVGTALPELWQLWSSEFLYAY